MTTFTNFCFTGPRKLTYEQGLEIERKLAEGAGLTFHVGDAPGADSVVRCYLEGIRLPYKLYRAEGKEPWQLAQRSKAMVDGCWELGNSKLIAFPNKPCPKGVKPSRNFAGKGSGTWGTIGYAKYLGMDIEIYWLEPGLTEPDWMLADRDIVRTEQLSLF
jgi:hypothetical protein